MIKLSIIIPAYNVETYISQLVESLYNQSNVEKNEYEVIVVNDGSLDCTLKRLIECQERFKDMSLIILNQENFGVSVARNNGLSKARGQYVWFIDSDDVIMEQALSDILWVLENHNIDVIRMGLLHKGFLDKDGILDIPSYGFDKDAFEEFEAYNLYIGENPLGHTRYIWRRKIIIDNNLKYPENISNNEDFLFLIKTISKANRAYVNNTMQYYLFRELPKSLSRGNNNFTHCDFMLRNMLFVLSESIKYFKLNKHLWSNAKKQAYEHILYKLKINAVSFILYRGQSWYFNRYYIKRLENMQCVPFDLNKRNKSLRMWVMNTPIALLLASFILRIKPIFVIFKKTGIF